MFEFFVFILFVAYAVFVGMVGVVFPLMAFSDVASNVFERVAKVSRFPKNLFASLAVAGSYTLFGAIMFCTYAFVGYLADVLDQRPMITGMLRLAIESEDSWLWLSLDGLFLAVPLAIFAVVVVGAVVMILVVIKGTFDFVVWLFSR